MPKTSALPLSRLPHASLTRSLPYFPMHLLNRASPRSVALETTLLLHGVPRAEAGPLAQRLAAAVAAGGGNPAIVGLVAGRPTVGLTAEELSTLLAADHVEKVNTANLGLAIHRRAHGATTVSTTVELAARAGVRVVATGGLGGVHRGFGRVPDISSDLAALARWPVAIVTSGAKSLLDLRATREVLETLGVPVVGFGTDSFPAFYVRETGISLDGRFDDATDLAAYLRAELPRSGRAVVVANPCPVDHAIAPAAWEDLLARAEQAASSASGREATPALLSQIHQLSGGASLRANIALAESNARLAGALAAAISA